jgi:hypothetical protein
VAAGAVGLVAAGVLSVVVPSPIGIVLVVVILVLALWIGVRLLLSQVTLTSDGLHYRGVFRSHSVPRERVVGLSEPGARAATAFADVPVLVWRDSHDDLERTTLWCLPLGMSASARAKVSESPRDAFRSALDAPPL